MDVNIKQKIRAYLQEQLEKRRDTGSIDDDESLFASGRLDSFTMMNLVMYLEGSCGVDFSQVEFDVNLVDSVNAIVSLINSQVTGWALRGLSGMDRHHIDWSSKHLSSVQCDLIDRLRAVGTAVGVETR